MTVLTASGFEVVTPYGTQWVATMVEAAVIARDAAAKTGKACPVRKAEREQDCEHGLSASLCAGPGHYPADDNSSEHLTASELMTATAAQYHARGETCPWDCAACDQPEEEPEQALPVLGEEGLTTDILRASAPSGVAIDGIYTLEKSDGNYRTLRIRTQEKDAEFAPGKRVISFLSGKDNTSDYTGFGFIVGNVLRVWGKFQSNASVIADAKTLMSDPTSVLTAAHCTRCHRTLTVPESIRNTVGPECSKKG